MTEMDDATATIKDLLPIPDDLDIGRTEVHTTMRTKPTESHALAMADHDEKGAAQLPERHGSLDDVADVGWNEDESKVPRPVVGGLKNEELWLLLRRFNNQVYHIKETVHPAPGKLDMNISQESDDSPDKLRQTIERLYITVIVGFMAFGKHIVRLRSWKERRRTALFCTAYFTAWVLDLIVPLLLTTLLVLIVHPPSRAVLFPPAPLALVSGKHGGVQKPPAGVLGSTDSATGAPENYKGEAVEQEASNFVNGIAGVALSSAAGKSDTAVESSDNEGSGDENSTATDPAAKMAPDPASTATGLADAKTVAEGGRASKKHDKTKEPMQKAIFKSVGPVMFGIAEVCDTWERFGNALSPTPPFPKHLHRLRLAVLVAPMLLGSFFATPYMVVKGATFGIGFGFFGDPIIQYGILWLNRSFPHWQRLLELRNTLFKGVPTNAQVTITLLRIGEANHAPVPPVPRTNTPPAHRTTTHDSAEVTAASGDVPLGASDAELQAAMVPDPTHEHAPEKAPAQEKPNKGSRFLNFFRGTTRATLSAAIGIDAAKAHVGSRHAKDRLGALPSAVQENPTGGPVEFAARYRGRKGRVLIATQATVPCVGFWPEKGAGQAQREVAAGEEARAQAHAIWSVPIGQITEVRKVGGYGWKGRMVVGWAFEREIKDGVEIVTKTGERHKVTAMDMRDELFNRLCAMGGQRWMIL